MPIIVVALCLKATPSFAENGDVYLECSYNGFKSLYKSPKIFKIARDGYAYDGPTKMKLNNEGIIDSYLFGSAIENNTLLMNSIDIFNGNWGQYILSKDELMRIKNIEDVTKNKVNTYARLDWKPTGACKSIDK